MQKQLKKRRKKRNLWKRIFPLLLMAAVLSAMLLIARDRLHTGQYEAMEASGDYPPELLEMLEKNPDLYDFVKDYPQKKGTVSADTVGDVTKGEFPLLLQWDERWGYGYYGESTVAVSGCAPTALSIVIAGLTGDNSVTPYEVACYAQENGYYIPGTGTDWSLMTDGCRHFGISGTELPLSETSIKNALNAGSPVVCSMRPGDFTTSGHFIVLTKTEDGKIRVNDPNSIENSRLWEYETLAPQIRNLWAFTVL